MSVCGQGGPVCFRELFELMSVPKSQQKGDGTDAVTLMELLIQKDSEVKSVLQLGQSTAVTNGEDEHR